MTAKWTAVEGMRLRELAVAGYSSAEIAREMNKTRGQVMGYVARNKIELDGRRTQEPMKDVRPSQHKRTPAPAQPTSRPRNEGNNHFNFRRAVELSKAPITQPQWPKAETPYSVDFLDAKEDHCRMPLWSGMKRTGKICGRPRMREGLIYKSSYCPGCHALILP
jgi:hypothetical protein